MEAPFEGIRVLDVSRWIAGSHCSLLLGDLGADVVKVESSTSGDGSRAVHPQINGESIYYLVYNRNKRGITLNFRHPKGPEMLRRLAAKADIIVENFRPGTMEAMGCSYSVLSELNPRLIMVSISGFGQDGPLARRPCFDSIAQAKSGLETMTGWPDRPPALVGTFIGDYSAALHASLGALAALWRREKTGLGQHVDVALLDSLLSMLMTAIPEYLLLGRSISRQGSRSRYVAPTGAFKSKDGWVQIAAGQDAIFARLLRAMGRQEYLQDPRFSQLANRLQHIDAVESLVTEWTEQHTAAEIEAFLEQAEVPCSKVCTIEDVVNDPQVAYRRQIVEVDHPTAGPVPLHGVTIKLSESPGSIRRAAPLLGEHNEEVYREWLGLSVAEVATLREDGVI